jgi:hypothetical protein
LILVLVKPTSIRYIYKFIHIAEKPAYFDDLDLTIFTVLCDNFSYDFGASTLRPPYLQFLAPSLREGDGVMPFQGDCCVLPLRRCTTARDCHESQRHAGQRWRDAIHDEEEKALMSQLCSKVTSIKESRLGGVC